MAERCASRRKRRPRKPVPRPVGWHLGGVGLAQADQVGGDGALREVPARGYRSTERGGAGGPAVAWSGVLDESADDYECGGQIQVSTFVVTRLLMPRPGGRR